MSILRFHFKFIHEQFVCFFHVSRFVYAKENLPNNSVLAWKAYLQFFDGLIVYSTKIVFPL